MLRLPRNSALLKAFVIGLLAMLMLIPLGLIEGLIAERASRRAEAVASVQASFAGQQTVALPFFVWPYVEHWTEQNVDASNRVRVIQMSEPRQLVWFADQSQANAEVAVKNDRYRGIHRVRTFESTISISATATWPDRGAVKPTADGRRIVWGEPRLILPIADVRGLRGSPVVNLDGKAVHFREGTQLPMLAAGLHVLLAESPAGSPMRLSINLELAGTERLAFAPTATASTVTVKSAWPDPHFGGSYLPHERTVTASGFSAEWAISALASGVQQQLRALTSGTPPQRPSSPHLQARFDTFEIDFIEAVNTYLLAERSAKHGALIIVLVFGAMFLFDTLRSLNAHPVRYGFVGLALVIFFLLLLSLSEHIAFGQAYSIAAAACTLLITHYLSHVLANRARALGFGGALLLMYATIYLILIAEDTALLMGSTLLFATLSVAMLATRKFDWRQISAGVKSG